MSASDQPIVLLPCPFCGSEPYVMRACDDADNCAMIGCNSCMIEPAIVRGGGNLDEMADVWNSRDVLTAVRNSVDRLSSMADERKASANEAFENGDDAMGRRIMAVHSGYIVASLVLLEELQNANLSQ